MIPDQPIHNDETFIPGLVEDILGEPMFFELAECLELGPWDSSQGGYHRLGCLSAREEAYWCLCRLLEHLRAYWMSPTVTRATNWLTQPGTLDALYEVVDEADYYLLSHRVRLVQKLTGSALTECLTKDGTGPSSPKVILSYKSLCQYLRSDAAISEFLDLTYGLQHEMTVETEIARALSLCCDQLREFWIAPPVARCLQWLTHDQNVLGALSASEYCTDLDTLERVSFVFCLVATVVERTEY